MLGVLDTSVKERAPGNVGEMACEFIGFSSLSGVSARKRALTKSSTSPLSFSLINHEVWSAMTRILRVVPLRYVRYLQGKYDLGCINKNTARFYYFM